MTAIVHLPTLVLTQSGSRTTGNLIHPAKELLLGEAACGFAVDVLGNAPPEADVQGLPSECIIHEGLDAAIGKRAGSREVLLWRGREVRLSNCRLLC